MSSTKSYPPRTSLYSIDPIKPDVTQIESFHHYIFRLATAHCLNVRSFLFWCISEKFPPLYLYENCHSAAFSTQEKLVNILEKLSKRDDLSEMTLLYFKGVLSDLNLHRRYQAWCPTCLSEKDNAMYEKLIWTITDITVCTRHEQKLIDKCHLCQKKQLQFVRYGYCRYCRYDLSNIESIKKASLSDLEHTEELINNLIKAPREKEAPDENSINYLMETYQLSTSSLSKAVSISPYSLKKELRLKPSLYTLLTLSHYFKYPLYMLLDKRLM